MSSGCLTTLLDSGFDSLQTTSGVHLDWLYEKDGYLHSLNIDWVPLFGPYYRESLTKLFLNKQRPNTIVVPTKNQVEGGIVLMLETMQGIGEGVSTDFGWDSSLTAGSSMTLASFSSDAAAGETAGFRPGTYSGYAFLSTSLR